MFAKLSNVLSISSRKTSFGLMALAGTSANLSSAANVKAEAVSMPELTLYKYGVCPFCNKVKTFLAFNKIPLYKEIEVNPFTKNELEFSKYKKVPILMHGEQQLNNSDDIIQHFLDSKDYEIKTKETQDSAYWREFVDDKLAPFLTIALYRSYADAKASFDYIASSSNFNAWERLIVRNFTPFFMRFFARGMMMKKRNLKNDEEAMNAVISALEEWTEFVIARSKSEIFVEDVVIYGILRVVDGNYSVWEDLKHIKFKNHEQFWTWYDNMKVAE